MSVSWEASCVLLDNSGIRVDLPTQSPQSAMIVGPGREPLTSITDCSTPSGEAVVFWMSNQYSRVTLVSGTFSYQFVLMSNPSLQHDLVSGPLVHVDESLEPKAAPSTAGKDDRSPQMSDFDDIIIAERKKKRECVSTEKLQAQITKS